MTKYQKEIAKALLISGHYLIERKNHKRKAGYMLYHGIQNPIRWFAKRKMYFILKYLKKDKKDRYTMNLNVVRRMHGKCLLKKLYKKRTELNTPKLIKDPVINGKAQSRNRVDITGQPVLFSE